MSQYNYISEGHYQDQEGNDYMSIWTYKRKNGIMTGDNYQDALAMTTNDKFKAPFNQTDRFKEGWMYSVNDLDEFYADRL